MIFSESVRFLRSIWLLSGGRFALALIMAFLAGVTESLSLVLLVPLVALSSAGVPDELQNLPLIGSSFERFTPNLEFLLLAFVTMVGVQAVLRRTAAVYNQQMLQLIGEKLRLTLFSAVSLSQWDEIRRFRMSNVNNALTNEVDRIIAATKNAQSFIQAFITLAIYIALAMLVSWQMTAFTTLVGVSLFAALQPLRNRAVAHGQSLSAMYMRQGDTLVEFINGIRLAKSFNNEAQQMRLYSDHLRSMRVAIVDHERLLSWGTAAFQIGVSVAGASFVWLAIRYLDLGFSQLALLVLIFARLTPRFFVIQETIQLFLSEISAFSGYQGHVARFLGKREEVPTATAPYPPLVSKLEMVNVNVRFEGNAAPGLSDVSMEIRAKRITAIIGPSGSGKSTLGDILIGLSGPTYGQFLVDGTLIDATNRRAWRSSVAIVPQDPYLLNDTVAVNLRLAKADAPDRELWQALEQAQCAELVRALPDGLETLAGDRGARFSGGERQRLSLARALLRMPQLLLLDEATSALDWENQRLIASSVSKLREQMTVVTIAHRPSLIAIADDVIALSKGRVVERGSYAELAGRESSALARMLAAERAA